MFHCNQCGAAQIELQLQPGLGHATITPNTFGDWVVSVPNYPDFVADLAFLNRFATCLNCKASQCWVLNPH